MLVGKEELICLNINLMICYSPFNILLAVLSNTSYLWFLYYRSPLTFHLENFHIN